MHIALRTNKNRAQVQIGINNVKILIKILYLVRTERDPDKNINSANRRP